MQDIQTHLQLALAKGLSRLDAEVLLAHILGESRVYLYSWPNKILSEKDSTQFNSLLMRRLAGEPIAYLIGKKEFWSLTLDVNPAVLIPRPETELLVELALKLLPNDNHKKRSDSKAFHKDKDKDGAEIGRSNPNKSKPIHILELGTGSGAIALALASERPEWTIIATDISAEALATASQNARKLSLNNVHFYLGDWFKALAPLETKQGTNENTIKGLPLFDAIISNPPYIAETDPHLSTLELSFEPLHALRSDDAGLSDLKKIIQTAEKYLLSKAWLLVEHGFDQGASVEAIFKANHYIHIENYKDLASVNRVTIGQKA